eukprot:gene6320-2943_t
MMLCQAGGPVGFTPTSARSTCQHSIRLASNHKQAALISRGAGSATRGHLLVTNSSTLPSPPKLSSRPSSGEKDPRDSEYLAISLTVEAFTKVAWCAYTVHRPNDRLFNQVCAHPTMLLRLMELCCFMCRALAVPLPVEAEQALAWDVAVSLAMGTVNGCTWCAYTAHWPSDRQYHQGLSDVAISLGVEPVNEFAWWALYTGLVTGSVIGAYYAHPTLLRLIHEALPTMNGDSGFVTTFLSLVSILYALLASNTFIFCYERQTNIIQELYAEAYAIEMILMQTLGSVTDNKDIRVGMARCVKRYIVEEMFFPEEMESPYVCDGAFMEILDTVEEAKGAGVNVSTMFKEANVLARAQSRRSAVAAGIMPSLHWMFLHTMELIFVATFLVFDASITDTVAKDHQLAFATLMGLLMLTAIVLNDLGQTSDGLYTFRGALDERLNYAKTMLGWLEGMPESYVPARIRTLQRLEQSTGRHSGMGGNIMSSESMDEDDEVINMKSTRVHQHTNKPKSYVPARISTLQRLEQSTSRPSAMSGLAVGAESTD